MAHAIFPHGKFGNRPKFDFWIWRGEKLRLQTSHQDSAEHHHHDLTVAPLPAHPAEQHFMVKIPWAQRGWVLARGRRVNGVAGNSSSLRRSASSRPGMMDGMVVLELASVLAGPTVCQFLAGMTSCTACLHKLHCLPASI
jgi:hypothetical protein